MLPNFVGIGAQRAGTTWIHSCLKEHPQVFVPLLKELHFFDENFDRELSRYKAQFTPALEQKAVDEITPDYISNDQAIPRMAQIIPDVKLFVIFRNPVERTYSAYQLFREKFLGLSFRQACEQESHLIHKSLYAKHLSRVFKYYPRNQVKIFLYEDLMNDQIIFLAKLFKFLEINENSSDHRLFRDIIE